MFVVVSYDISDDRRRGRVANALEDFGERVQLSVFECRLEPAQLDRLRRRMLKLLKLEEDRLRIYRLCAACVPSIEIFGPGRIVEDSDAIVV